MTSRWSRALGGEEGFSLIEVLVAALILVLIISSATVLFADGNDSSVASERDSQLISVADQQIETIREEVKTEGFDLLAMNAAPAAGSGSTFSYSSTTYADPNHFVSASTGCGLSNEGYEIEANYDNTSGGAAPGVLPWSGCTDTSTAVAEPLEILSGGFVTPQQTNVAVGTDTATVDTYVTDTYVGCTSSAGELSTCPTTTGNVVAGCSWPTAPSASTTCADARRVTVAVVLGDHGSRFNIGQSSPVYVSTVFTSPTPSNAPNTAIGLTLGVQLG
jgi:type II secretory pathway pseudopilin PulG